VVMVCGRKAKPTDRSTQAEVLRNHILSKCGLSNMGSGKAIASLMLEDQSFSTTSAATYCKALLSRKKTRLDSGIKVITMDFNTERAAQCFQKAFPDCDVTSVGAPSAGFVEAGALQILQEAEAQLLDGSGNTATARPLLSSSVPLAVNANNRAHQELFGPDGSYLEYNGNLILCRLPPEVLNLVTKIQSVLRNSQLQDKYSFPPSEAIHLQILRIVQDGAKKEAIYPRQSWKDIHQDVWARTAPIRRACPWALFRGRLGQINADLTTITLEPCGSSVEGLRCFQQAALEDLRFGARLLDQDMALEIRFAYLLKPAGLHTEGQAEVDALQRQMRGWMDPLGEVALPPPILCYFSNAKDFCDLTELQGNGYLKPCGCDTRYMLCIHDANADVLQLRSRGGRKMSSPGLVPDEERVVQSQPPTLETPSLCPPVVSSGLLPCGCDPTRMFCVHRR